MVEMTVGKMAERKAALKVGQWAVMAVMKVVWRAVAKVEMLVEKKVEKMGTQLES